MIFSGIVLDNSLTPGNYLDLPKTLRNLCEILETYENMTYFRGNMRKPLLDLCLICDAARKNARSNIFLDFLGVFGPADTK